MKSRIIPQRRNVKNGYIAISEVEKIMAEQLNAFAACCAAAHLLAMDETPGIGHKRMAQTAENYSEWMRIFGQDAADGALIELIHKRLSERGLTEIFTKMGYEVGERNVTWRR